MKKTLLAIYEKKIPYLILFGGLILGLVAFFSLSSFRVPVVIVLCVYYFFWGIVHHWAENDLHIKIILEYFFVATIACLVLLSLIWRA